ncbi:MAG: hypothetical protein PF542_00065 [Nanoarchaeota archaeon]|jgi:aminoglycoside phosphotransferase (APT) family kinase protein|nr:hypothetical protein [Nanoarchaeota archaeon]
MVVSKDKLKIYLEEKFGAGVKNLKVSSLGKGMMGEGSLVEFDLKDKKHRYVLKSIFANNLGMDHFSDRAQSFLLAHDSYNSMKNHVRSKDVLARNNEGSLKSVGDSKEFYILMDEAKGEDFFMEMDRVKILKTLDLSARKKILTVSDFLVELHTTKGLCESQYKRKIRNTFSGDGSIMEILDIYPKEEFVKRKEIWKRIVSKAISQWEVSKEMSHRSCEIHGDLHPGNIWFDGDDLVLLDRSRGIVGEPADDISAFLINMIFYSVIETGKFSGVFKEMFDLFWNNYFLRIQDREMRKVLGLFFAFRATVLCHPSIYSDEFFGSAEKAEFCRSRILNFVENVLHDKEFNPAKINDYLVN